MPDHLPALRPASDADAPAARALVFEVLREYGLSPDPEGTDRDLDALEANYGRAGGAFGVLVDSRGAVVGTVGLMPVKRESGQGDGAAGDPDAGVGPAVELRKMYLHREYRGSGQGRRLLDWALAEARRLGFRTIMLETATVLGEAIRLYERSGFRRVPGCPNACRCDVVMERAL